MFIFQIISAISELVEY